MKYILNHIYISFFGNSKKHLKNLKDHFLLIEY